MTDDILVINFTDIPSLTEFGIKEKLFPSYLKHRDSMPLKNLCRF
jgi:hypothetical protein